MSIKSLHSFEAILKDGSRDSKCKRVLRLIKESSDTISGLVFRSGLNYSTVTARVRELVERGYVKYNSDPTGGQSWIVYVSDEKERESLREKVRNEQYQAWYKRGKLNNWL